MNVIVLISTPLYTWLCLSLSTTSMQLCLEVLATLMQPYPTFQAGDLQKQEKSRKIRKRQTENMPCEMLLVLCTIACTCRI